MSGQRRPRQGTADVAELAWIIEQSGRRQLVLSLLEQVLAAWATTSHPAPTVKPLLEDLERTPGRCQRSHIRWRIVPAGTACNTISGVALFLRIEKENAVVWTRSGILTINQYPRRPLAAHVSLRHESGMSLMLTKRSMATWAAKCSSPRRTRCPLRCRTPGDQCI